MFPTKRKSTYREKRKRKSRVLNKLKVMQSTAKRLHRTSEWVTWLCASGGTILQGPQSARIRASSSVTRQGHTRRLTQRWEGPRPLRLSCGRWHKRQYFIHYHHIHEENKGVRSFRLLRCNNKLTYYLPSNLSCSWKNNISKCQNHKTRNISLWERSDKDRWNLIPSGTDNGSKIQFISIHFIVSWWLKKNGPRDQCLSDHYSQSPSLLFQHEIQFS